MDLVRDVASAAKSIRESQGLRRRLPLGSLTVALDGADRLERFRGVLADEVNVKAVELAGAGSLGTERFEVDLRRVGPTLGRDTPAVVKALRAGDYRYDPEADELVVNDHRFGPGAYVRKLDADDPGATAALPGGTGLVALDLEVTPALEAEGLARDLARQVNDLRRAEGLDISDRITLIFATGHHDDIGAAIETHRELIAEATLATDLQVVDRLVEAHRVELADGRALHITLDPRT